MVRNVVTLAADMTLEQAAERLTQHAISGAPVVDDRGRLLGILSESDLLRHLKKTAEEVLGKHYLTERAHSLALWGYLREQGHSAVEEVYRKVRAAHVRDAMTRNVATVRPTDSLETVASIMISRDVNRVPVVEGDEVVGIIARADLARVLARGSPDVPRL